MRNHKWKIKHQDGTDEVLLKCEICDFEVAVTIGTWKMFCNGKGKKPTKY